MIVLSSEAPADASAPDVDTFKFHLCVDSFLSKHKQPFLFCCR